MKKKDSRHLLPPPFFFVNIQYWTKSLTGWSRPSQPRARNLTSEIMSTNKRSCDYLYTYSTVWCEQCFSTEVVELVFIRFCFDVGAATLSYQSNPILYFAGNVFIYILYAISQYSEQVIEEIRKEEMEDNCKQEKEENISMKKGGKERGGDGKGVPRKQDSEWINQHGQYVEGGRLGVCLGAVVDTHPAQVPLKGSRERVPIASTIGRDV